MRAWIAFGLIACGAACTSAMPGTDDDDGGGDDDGTGSGSDGGVPPSSDPFAPQADTSEGLTNVSDDLDAVLEHGALATACDDYAAAPDDRRLRLLCGKAMFFYEGFGTAGVPRPLMDWLLADFPVEVGPGFAGAGMIEDPSSGLPLGFGPGAPFGKVDSLAFTCASCHFARLPDGRYAVGAPNHAFDYGRMNLMIALVPTLSMPGGDPSQHDADAVAAVQPLRDRMAADSQIGTDLWTALLPLLGSGASLPPFTAEIEHYYARWRSGTMDFMIQPLPVDDGVHTVSKISSLWGIAEQNAQLGWTGIVPSVMNFLRGFVLLGGGDVAAWPNDRLEPLAEYVLSLRAPAGPAQDAAAVGRGAEVFAGACLDCHGGPRGMGEAPYTYEEIGTDDAMRWWVDGADHDGEPCCGITLQEGEEITHAIKSPRLVGLWAQSRFLHNGGLDSLEQLLCVEPRPRVTELAFGTGGHTFGCDLPGADRADLLAYLRAH